MAPAVIIDDYHHQQPHQNGSHGIHLKQNGKHGEGDGFSTRAVHVGSEVNEETGAVIPAISLSTTYRQNGVGNHKGFEYSRTDNPNRNALERTLSSLESGGAYALTFASGSAATATILQSLNANAHVLSVNDVYGGTFRYMTSVASVGQGLEVTFLDLENVSDEVVIDAIRPNTKLIWIESPTNPTLRMVDVKRITSLAHAHPSHPLVLVDNTFLSPYFASPFLHGADLILHSLSKYVNGHSDVIMGALVLPAHHAPLANYLRYLQNAVGAIPSAYDCWLAQRGAKTLQLRMRAHGKNALVVARALVGNERVREVVYPGLKEHKRHGLAYKSLAPHARRWVDGLEGTEGGKGDFPYGGMVSFRIADGGGGKTSEEAASKFLKSTRLFTLAESLGGVESLVELPSKMTHGAIPEAERAVLGIGDDLIRLSVGVEDADDLVKDLEQALRRAFEDDDEGEEEKESVAIPTPESVEGW